MGRREKKIKKTLYEIYGSERGERAFEKIAHLFSSCVQEEAEEYFSEKDVFLITYGDSLKEKDQPPLSVLSKFARMQLKGIFSSIHILPFFPYSSDDGFSVMDYYRINPEIGSWEDVGKIQKDFRLMFDLVINHVSSQSGWFKRYLAEEKGFEQLAIECDPSLDLSLVTRPRASPLLTPFAKGSGERVHLWTTFSADQIDLNFRSIDLLEKMVDVLLFYVKQGASAIRLDAIAYLWKEIDSKCIHLPETHSMVKLLRQIINCAKPEAIIITETNVPHEENISYFGNGHDEAQMVYNFTLPPLLLHSFIVEDITLFSDWVASLSLPSSKTTFYNFTASHDGIGIRPLEGIISKEELKKVINHVYNNGGRVSYKRDQDGTESPYELNITYVDALMKKDESGRDEHHVERFIASQSIAMVLPGVPAVYIHSLLGSHNWNEGVERTGRARTINREKLDYEQLMNELNDPSSFRSRVFNKYIDLLKIRIEQPAFHPNASFRVLRVDPKVFSMVRETKRQRIFVLVNISSQPVSENCISPNLRDLISGSVILQDKIKILPYQIMWLSD